jgi:hypothetical protein
VLCPALGGKELCRRASSLIFSGCCCLAHEQQVQRFAPTELAEYRSLITQRVSDPSVVPALIALRQGLAELLPIMVEQAALVRQASITKSTTEKAKLEKRKLEQMKADEVSWDAGA